MTWTSPDAVVGAAGLGPHGPGRPAGQGRAQTRTETAGMAIVQKDRSAGYHLGFGAIRGGDMTPAWKSCRLATVLGGVCVALLLVGPAAAGGRTSWSPALEIDRAGPGLALAGVSCPTVHECVAVDDVGQEVTFNPLAPDGAAPAMVDAGGGGLASVACSSVARCTAVDPADREVTFDPGAPGGATRTRMTGAAAGLTRSPARREVSAPLMMAPTRRSRSIRSRRAAAGPPRSTATISRQSLPARLPVSAPRSTVPGVRSRSTRSLRRTLRLSGSLATGLWRSPVPLSDNVQRLTPTAER